MVKLTCYLVVGIMLEILVIKSYIKHNPHYDKIQYLIGSVIDIVAWPIVLLGNIIGNTINWGR